MTRINCIPVEELTNRHLVAEYREISRIPALSDRWASNDDNISWIASDLADSIEFRTWKLPDTYRFGKGHVQFFYDKGEWLRRRFEEELVPEMQRRGFKTSFVKYRMHHKGLNNDWAPTEEAKSINRQRIAERLKK